MKRRTLFSIIVITLTAGFFTLFYGMHSTWTDTRSAQAVQAATDQVNDLFKDQSHQLPSDQLNKQAIAAAETKLQQARQKADVDAAKHMLIVKDAVAQNATKLDELKTLSDKSQQALTELAKQKPTFVQTYQKRVAQLSDQEAAVAKIASLFSDTDFKTPKPNLSSAQVQAALAVEKLDNKQFADQVMPLISTAQDATAGEDSRDTEPSASSVLPSSADSSQPAVADSSSQASSSTASSSESEQSQASSSTSTATSSSSQNP